VTAGDGNDADRGKKKNTHLKCDFTLCCLATITLLSNSAYSIIAPFLPIELKNMGIPIDYFGYIFSMYSVSVILGSPLIGYLLTKFPRRSFV